MFCDHIRLSSSFFFCPENNLIFLKFRQHCIPVSYTHLGQLGIYHCPNCGWERPDPDFTATQITLKDELYAFDMGDLHLDSTVRTPYNIYNTLAAYTALHTMHAPMAHFKEMAESFDYGNNREEILMINGARVQLHLSLIHI